jgi:hypothetical protein
LDKIASGILQGLRGQGVTFHKLDNSFEIPVKLWWLAAELKNNKILRETKNET